MHSLIYLLLVSLSLTRLSFFKVGMAEFTLFHFLVLVVLFFKFFIALGRKRMRWKQPLYFSLALFYMVIVNLLNYGSIKHSSFFYSLFIIVELILLYNIIAELSIERIKQIAKITILLYFINIIVATGFILLHYYPQGLLGNIFQIYNFDQRIRPYGFSNEPSYAAITLVFALYLLFKCDNFKYHKEDVKWYIMSILAIFLTGSSYGYLILGVFLIYLIIKNRVIYNVLVKIRQNKIFTSLELAVTIVLVLGICSLLLSRIDFSNNKSVNRLVKVISTLSESDQKIVENIKKVVYVDGSASMRLVPTLQMIEAYKYEQWKYILFGRGAGNSVYFFSLFYEGNITVLGFIPSFIYNYGLIGATIFILFFLSLFPQKKKLLFILFFLFLLNADFNTQIFLFILFTIMATKQIETQKLTMLTHG